MANLMIEGISSRPAGLQSSWQAPVGIATQQPVCQHERSRSRNHARGNAPPTDLVRREDHHRWRKFDSSGDTPSYFDMSTDARAVVFADVPADRSADMPADDGRPRQWKKRRAAGTTPAYPLSVKP
ncbi:hypothetical protein [Sorangium sp. So ce887]|uniref:hypothetical protein n=1 Tax=Sorangium sp. So ce887 TaxID=3133324 RepID=UPI003F6434CF